MEERAFNCHYQVGLWELQNLTTPNKADISDNMPPVYTLKMSLSVLDF